MMFSLPPLAGRVTLNLLQHRDTSKSWSQLRDNMDLDQDLLAVTYSNGLVLDVGWYDDARPDSCTANASAGGAFRVVCIRRFDWDKPVLSIFARDFVELRRAIETADAWVSNLES